MTTATRIDIPATPTPTHLASLAAALESGAPAVIARVFGEIADEALVLAEQAPTERLWRFWLDLSETAQHEATQAVSA